MNFKTSFIFLCLFIFINSESHAQKIFKPKFSVYLQGGAYLDITGNFNDGYNFGFGGGLLGTRHFELFCEVNINAAEEKFSGIMYNLKDYSLGGRIYIGRLKPPIIPFVEFSFGLYTDFRDFGNYKKVKGGIGIGGGASFNISRYLDVHIKEKIHLPSVSGGHPGGGFYVYSGTYVSLKYTF